MTVTYPGGTTGRPLWFDERISATEAVYRGLTPVANINDVQPGIYTFTVTDTGGHETLTTDDFVVNALALPENVVPEPGSSVTAAAAVVDWDDVPGASGYRVRIYDGWNHVLHTSGDLTQSAYTVPEEVLDAGVTYGYRIYSYREAYPAEDLDNLSVYGFSAGDRSRFVFRPGADLGTVSGRVSTDLAGHPDLGVAGAQVTLSGGGTLVTTTTDANGTYTFSGVPAGNYTLSVAASGLDPVSTAVTVGAGEDVTVTDLPDMTVPAAATDNPWDVGDDGIFGFPEIIYGLQVLSGDRTMPEEP